MPWIRFSYGIRFASFKGIDGLVSKKSNFKPEVDTQTHRSYTFFSKSDDHADHMKMFSNYRKIEKNANTLIKKTSTPFKILDKYDFPPKQYSNDPY